MEVRLSIIEEPPQMMLDAMEDGAETLSDYKRWRESYTIGTQEGIKNYERDSLKPKDDVNTLEDIYKWEDDYIGYSEISVVEEPIFIQNAYQRGTKDGLMMHIKYSRISKRPAKSSIQRLKKYNIFLR